MPLILPQRVPLVLPSGRLEINRSHPTAEGLIGCYVASQATPTGIPDLRGIGPLLTGTILMQPSPGGPGLGSDTTRSTGVQATTSLYGPSTGAPGVGVYTALAAVYYYDGIVNNVATDTIWGGNNNYFCERAFAQGQTLLYTGGGGGPQANGPTTPGVCAMISIATPMPLGQATSITYWFNTTANGILTTGTAAGFGLATADTILYMGQSASGAASHCVVLAGFQWSFGTFAPANAFGQRFVEDPFAMLRPVSRRLYYRSIISAGGPTTGTLALTQADQTLAATGTAPLITGTLAVTQANQTVSATGGPVVSGVLGPDTATVLLVHADGTAGSTAFIDSSLYAHTLTTSGLTQVNSTAKFGTGAASFGSTLASIGITSDHAAFNFGASPFTIEAWCYVTGSVSTPSVVSQTNQIGPNIGWRLWLDSTHLYFDYSTTGANDISVISSYVIPSTTWVHIAVDCDASGTIRLYANGAVLASATRSAALFNSTLNCLIGNDLGAGNNFPGYLDEVRVSKGVARFGSAFTPPTAPYGGSGLTQADQTLSAAGTVVSAGAITGTLAVTQANQTLVAAGTVTVGATLNQTQANQTLAATGRVLVSGALGITEALDTIAATGTIAVSGTLGVLQAPQTLIGSGAVFSGIGANLVITQANQTLVGAGTVTGLVAALNLVQASQILVSTGGSIVRGTLGLTQANQTLMTGSSAQVRVMVMA